MGRSLRWGVGAAAAVTVAVLTLGGSGGAWAAAASSAAPTAWALPSWCTSSVSGSVTTVGTGSFTLTESDGTVVTVTTTASTTHAETGVVGPPTGVAAGEQVTVTTVPGTSHTATSVTAARVLVVLTYVVGTVGSVGAGSFSVHLVGGLVVTVGTGPTTVVRKAGVVQSGVSAGEYVTAYGGADPSDPSRLDAQFVVISTPPTAHPTPIGGGHTGSSPLLAGVVSAAAGGFTLTEAGDSAVTVTTTSTTTYGETGSQTAPSGVSDGEQVRVRSVDGTSSSATSVTAERVVVVLTQVTGVVQSVGTGTFAVQLVGGLVLTVETTGATVYAVNGAPATGVTVGERLTAYGAPDPSAPAQLIAQFVDLHPQPTSGGHHGWLGSGESSGWTGTGSDGDSGGDGHHPTTTPSGTDPVHTFVWGTVRSVTGDDITVVEPSGATVTVVVSTSTRYDGRSGAGGLAAIASGTVVGVAGTSAAASQVDALVVFVGGNPSTGDHSGGSGGGTPGDGSANSTTTATAVPSGASHSGPTGGSRGAGRGASEPTSGSTPTTIPSSFTSTTIPSSSTSMSMSRSTTTTGPSTGSGDTTWSHPGSGGGAEMGAGRSSGGSGQRGSASSGHWG